MKSSLSTKEKEEGRKRQTETTGGSGGYEECEINEKLINHKA